MNKPKFVSAGISGDGKAPAKTPWGASLRMPIGVTVPAADSAGNPGRALVKFGLSCDCPLLVWAHTNVANHALKASEGLHVVNPGDELTVVLENPTSTLVSVMESTMFLNVAFIVPSEFDFVK